MKVSTIIPTFNRRAYIRRAIESVLAQTLPVDEIIVVDDGSTDDTADALETWYGSRIRVIRQKNTGVAGARRRGIQECNGEWIAFLDSDDEWLPNRNRELLAAAELAPKDVAWIFGDLCVVTDTGTNETLFQEHALSVSDYPHVFQDALSVQFPFQFGMLQASLIRKCALVELNCFTEGLRSDDDLLAGFQVACRYRYAAIPSIVGRYFRTSDLAISSVVMNGRYGPDHFRSRMMSFALVIKSGRKRPWNLRYAAEVRGLCKTLAARGNPVPRKLAFEQFRFGGISAKGLAFFLASMLGPRGIQFWDSVAKRRKQGVASGCSPRTVS